MLAIFVFYALSMPGYKFSIPCGIVNTVQYFLTLSQIQETNSNTRNINQIHIGNTLLSLGAILVYYLYDPIDQYQLWNVDESKIKIWKSFLRCYLTALVL